MASTPHPIASLSSSSEGGERIRLTISVTPEVHAAFSRLSAATNLSLSRSMGDWLHDTLEAVEFMAKTAEDARAAPKRVLRQLHGFALGLADESEKLMESMRKGPGGGHGEARSAPGGRVPVPPPRPVIRGGKSTDSGKARGGKS